MKIDDHIPIPERARAGRKSVLREAFQGLKQVGQSFSYPITSSIRSSKVVMSKAKREHAPRIKIRMAEDPENPNNLRVWREE